MKSKNDSKLKEDKRKYRSKRDLALALQDLLMEKDFGDITIQEITDRALISKLTFYNNFVDKYELLSFLFSTYATKVYDDIEEIMETDIPIKNKYEECIKVILKDIHSLPFALDKIIKTDTSKPVYWSLYNFVEEATGKIAALYGSILNLKVPSDIISYHYAGSVSSLIYNLGLRKKKGYT